MKEKGIKYRSDPNYKQKRQNYLNDTEQERKEWQRQYDNSRKISRNEKRREKLKNNLIFKFKHKISSQIRAAMKRNKSLKNKKSSIDYLGYSIEELIFHLEKLFEPWMNWDNYGAYKVNEWDDNDQTTWKWNMDHIIPQSLLPYTSMADENFKKCWALENLRPYSSKENLLKSNKIIIDNDYALLNNEEK